MLLRRIAVGAGLALLAILLYALWRDLPLREWLRPTHTVRRELVFDNGSVRDGQPAPDGPRVAAQSAPGALRKCVRGERISYSNLGCPEGWREQAVARGQVNVIAAPPSPSAHRTATTTTPGSPQPGAAPGAQGRPGAPGAQEALRQSVDLRRDEALRERQVERVIDGGGSR